ncbi:SpoIIIAH-like family protein [[Clostridium] dakarense]|uniref:SpoIIIAH-like family protein n=1 Tax=Faecalimicrobium dakarense TaxID=1301100 RepID=UPI0004AE4633|nr:SpoIIIAH-like family protein [[Clostridium] dakarense]
MKFNYKGRGFVVVSLAAMLVVVGTVNYKLSQKSVLETSKEMKAYEQAQMKKNEDNENNKEAKKEASKEDVEVEVVDSKTNKINEKATETSKEIKNQLTSEKNMKKATYILDMKMTREKQRNELTQDLNEMINNPSTTEESRKEASSMKLQLVKDQETELKIENLLSAKGFEDALVYISNENVNVVVNEEKLEKADAAKVFDLVAQQASVKYENIKLMNNNQN